MTNVKSQAIGNYFLDKARKDDTILTNLKMQKIVYIAYGFYAYFLGEKLFNGKIEAWRHGPVMPALYHEVKQFGAKPIPDDFSFISITEIDDSIKEINEFGDYDIKIRTPSIYDIEDKKTRDALKKILDLVWQKYSIYTGWSLRNLTHLQDTPWSETYANGEGEFKEIPFEEIKEYYTTFVKTLLKESE